MSSDDARDDEIILKKKRRKWPWAVGAAAVAITATGGLVAANLAPDTVVFEHEVEVLISSSNIPAERILDYVIEQIAPEYGITVSKRYLDDYTEINRAVDSGEVAANYAQNAPFLSDQIAANSFEIESVGNLGHFSAGLFSNEYTSLDDVRPGSTIALRDDPAGQARAILALRDLGLVTLKDDAEPLPQLTDIAANLRDVEFVAVDIAALARVFEDVDFLAGYYADVSASGVVPPEKIIEFGDVIEGWDQLLVVSSNHVDDPGVQALISAFEDPRITEWIESSDDEVFQYVLGAQHVGPNPLPER